MKKKAKSKTDRSFEDWEDNESRKDLKHRIQKLRLAELEEDDYADFDPLPYYERDETVGEDD